jgi:hypothetical protein
MSFELTKYTHQSTQFYLLKNRRQKHELLRHLQQIYQVQNNERVFHESIFKELIQRPTYITPIYENAMNLLLYITLIHNVPTCFAVQQYTSQNYPFLQQRNKYEPAVWNLQFAIPSSWDKILFDTQQHTIVVQAELVFPDAKTTIDKRPLLIFERVLFNGSNREQQPLSFHIDELQHLTNHINRFTFASIRNTTSAGIRFAMKKFDSLKSFDPRKTHDSDLEQTIIGFRMYSLKNPIVYYHHLAYKSYKVNELDPFSINRIRLLQCPITEQFYHSHNNTTVDNIDIYQKVHIHPSSEELTVMAVNMRDHHNMYGVYQLYSPAPVKQKTPHILRLETFEQHVELTKLGKKQSTIYLSVWFHPYFRKWCLAHRDFAKNIVVNPKVSK